MIIGLKALGTLWLSVMLGMLCNVGLVFAGIVGFDNSVKSVSAAVLVLAWYFALCKYFFKKYE